MGSYNPILEFGPRLLPVNVDYVAQNDPKRVFASLPFSDDDLSKGCEDITYDIYAEAISKVAYFIERSFGCGERTPTIAYPGPPYTRYHILQMTVAKTSYNLYHL
jgi:hypothetical protein